ncbi:uncharacterized protein [Primulina eburnea]|uniref:uncharacterized protein n=1 Tax=Primulina eburnea TaxID=1245227 RepID=UPI003C6C4F21
MKESLQEEPIHMDTVALLRSLLDSISHVQIFKGKWSLIKVKLATLETRLSEISVSSAAENPLSFDLLQSLSATCSAAAFLCALCHGPTLHGGKLKTQNDIDSLSAKLNAHINDLGVLVRSGIFFASEHRKSVSSSMSVVESSRRESVRAEARNLTTRLQIGSTESKNSTLDLLLGLLQEDDKNLLIAVAQGIVPVLVRLLDSSNSSEIKERAVTAIAKISTVDSSKHVLLAEGLALLNNLLRVLESGSIFAKEKSCIALIALSNLKENARAIGSRGGISSLLEICREGTPISQAVAAGVLRNLAVFTEIKENFVEENAVLTLLALCNSGTALALENSIGCLCNLVSGDDDLKLFVAREVGIENLKILLDSAPTAQNLEVVVEFVRTLSSCSNIAEFLAANGFLNLVVGALSFGEMGVRIAAAKAVYALAYSSKTKKELGEIGCIVPLVKMLDGKAVEEKEAAAKALSTLMNYAGNRKILRKEEKGIVSVVILLDPSVQNLDKKFLLSTLASLVHSKKCRKQMVAARAGDYLQKLVDLNVDGAKSLVDSLGRGKLWRVFAKH